MSSATAAPRFGTPCGASSPHVVAARAPYACDPARSRGRLYAEAEAPTRSAFQRDRDRILHCAAFRRLMYKTQVFIAHEGDNFRTRLTHSLEVAQIARSISRRLGLDEDLTEAVALAHDLGHTPFGHAGGDTLDCLLANHGGFDHNDQTIRILTHLERRYAGFDGLNLTWECLEGVAKHNGPLTGPDAGLKATARADAFSSLRAYDLQHDLWLGTYPALEAQIAAVSDDIAYNSHDLDDGWRAGLFALDDLVDVPLAGPIAAAIAAAYPGLAIGRLINETIRRVITAMVDDVLAETKARLDRLRPESADAIRCAGRPLAGFSQAMQLQDAGLKRFLHERMYRHGRVMEQMNRASRLLTELFSRLSADPSLLPPEWQNDHRAAADDRGRARVIADYVAGMTDRHAVATHGAIMAKAERCGVSA